MGSPPTRRTFCPFLSASRQSHSAALESLLCSGKPFERAEQPTHVAQTPIVCLEKSLIEHSSPHALCHPDRAECPGMQFLSGAHIPDSTAHDVHGSHISTRREDTPHHEVSTVQIQIQIQLKPSGVTNLPGIKPRRWLSLENQWETMKLLTDQYWEGRERVEVEEFNPVACLKYKLEVNMVGVNKCEEK